MLWKHNNKFNREVNKAFATEKKQVWYRSMSALLSALKQYGHFFCNLVDVATREEGTFCDLQDAFGNRG